MSKYIDAEAAKKVIKDYGRGAINDGMETLDPVSDIVLLANAIDWMPAADVAPVVRCRYCQQWDADPDTYGSVYGPKGLCRKSFETTTCDDFCSYGESLDGGAGE